jgi:hypothetical protein
MLTHMSTLGITWRMNKIIALLAVAVGCGTDRYAAPSVPPDSAVVLDAAMADAAHDAAPPDAAVPPPLGCDDMGNLPGSRTITLTPGDPVPSALLDEMQDMIVGARRGQFTRRFQPCNYYSTSPTFWALAQNPSGVPAQFQPVLKTASATVVSAYFQIPFEPGETLIGATMDFFGDGTVLPITQIMYSPNIHTTASSPGFINSATVVSATWTTITGSLAPQVLVQGSSLWFSVTTTSISTANNYLGPVSFTFTH